MKTKLAILTIALLAGVVSTAQAAVVDNTSLAAPGLYYGGGNQPNNSGFTVNTANGIELGLGVNNRKGNEVAPTGNTSVYNVNTGFYTTPADFCTGNCAVWNFQFSVNLAGSGLVLGQVTTNLSIFNVGTGQTLSFNPFAALPDNSAFNGTSTRNGNVPGQQATVADVGFQNGENLRFFVPPYSPLNPNFSFDPLANDTYVITLSVADASIGLNMSVDETIIAGTGATATPLPAALPLFASGLGVVGFIARRRKRKAALAA